jgi:hypothetical protein
MQFSDAQKSYIKQRQSPRHRENRRAWVDVDNGSRPLDCAIWDLSEAGVRFTIETPSRVPFDFFLVLSKDGKDRRRCQVIWRSDDQVGACFLPAPNLS